jgi:predicted membrane channel-forming protein YqfA (hemolysin III family)
MRFVLFLTLTANSLDLVATSFGIHWFGNREGNPLLAALAQQHWGIFVLIKGLLVPALIVRLYSMRERSPVIASAGLAMVLVALTMAVGQWLGWMAGVLHVSALAHL